MGYAKKERWLVTGASGLLGHTLCAYLASRGETVAGVCFSHPIDIPGVEEIVADISQGGDFARSIVEFAPSQIVHAAGLTSVDGCERDPAQAHKLHVDGTQAVVDAARQVKAALAYISTDHLWDGTRPMVDETVPTYPLNVYARTKLAGEAIVTAADPSSLIVRTNFFGPGRPWRRSFSDWILDSLSAGNSLSMFDDVFFTPISLAHFCPFLVTLTEKKTQGVLHLAGGERLSKFAFAKKLAAAAGLPEDRIRWTSITGRGLDAPRPKDMSLDTRRAASILGRPMPQADEGIASLFAKNVSTQSRPVARSATGPN